LRAKWDADLSFATIAEAGTSQRFPNRQVYVDVIPIFISAIQRASAWLATSDINAVGFDGKTYAEHFKKLASVDLLR